MGIELRSDSVGKDLGEKLIFEFISENTSADESSALLVNWASIKSLKIGLNALKDGEVYIEKVSIPLEDIYKLNELKLRVLLNALSWGEWLSKCGLDACEITYSFDSGEACNNEKGLLEEFLIKYFLTE